MAPRKPAPAKKQPPPPPVHPIWEDDEEEYTEDEEDLLTDEEDMEGLEDIEEEDEEEDLDEDPQEEPREQAVADSQHLAPRAPQAAPAPSAAAAPSKSRSRWDRKPAAAGKGSYKSWRAHKARLLWCLGESGGDVNFTRRYMLFHHGVNIPRNVIHYYHQSYSGSDWAEIAAAASLLEEGKNQQQQQQQK
ncbi:22K [Titi monkey adenovirus ECC-2011]|uniref:22K n=1 Tax=titi monkey adenovirus 1 TaxID=3123084 RepID=G0ZAI9_9ADEN|nr:22K [Titi monkey adenovirus ECC-2011]AEK98459.1 22K [Titi monkey adenovirus ECC-2011]